MLDTIFKNIGELGPIILIVCSLFILQKKQTLLFYYVIGFFIQSILNLVLKGIIKEPRPNEEDKKLFSLAIKNGHRLSFKNGIPLNIYGMPSGHSSACLYSTIFIYLFTRNSPIYKNVMNFYLLISFITITQRVAYNMHTISQVIVGAIVGGLIGYFMYKFARSKLQGKITEKLDDFGPI